MELLLNDNLAKVSFEDLYAALRAKEGRICSNEELRGLPDTDSSHPHHSEWKMRKQSSGRFIHYLTRKKKPLRILEAGCGNGWLSHRMARVRNTLVTGIDVHTAEVMQASEVFFDLPNLEFFAGDFRVTDFQHRFDIIVFAASVQYFPSLGEVVRRAFSLLAPDGELHIMDSHFYEEVEVKEAAERTSEYFEKLGLPQMTSHYHHHRWCDLEGFTYETLHSPNRLGKLLGIDQNPFPWIRLKK